MCRLYGFRANEPTKVECTLVHAQNALMVQSKEDLSGYRHGHGWGVATYRDGRLQVERQAWAAYHGEHFKRAAARIFSCTVLAHVRRATVGPPAPENTHPFVEDRWAFAHNGTLPNFERLRPRILEATAPRQRALIRGVTDSEHIFHLLMSQLAAAPQRPLIESLRALVERLIAWSRAEDPEARIGLNLMLTDGAQLVGSRIGRSLYVVERDGVRDCAICGFPHVHHDPRRDYRAVVVASEPLTGEAWRAVPEGSVYQVSRDVRLGVEPL